MKRRPPQDNVRRVRHINGNIRSTFTSKTNRIIQCESDNEFLFALLLDRDPTVVDYISQPDTIQIVDKQGRKRTYTPDYKVWRANGQIEMHEVTVTQRREARPSLRAREEAATSVYKTYGWHYLVHTELDLPQGAEQANLRHLFGFRAASYAKPTVQAMISDLLDVEQSVSFQELRQILCNQLNIQISLVSGALLHLLWHHHLDADMGKLFFVNGQPAHTFSVWKPAHE